MNNVLPSSSSCYCCLHATFTSLPVLPQTIISDGTLWKKELNRKLCEKCGAAVHSTALTMQDINEIYSDSYSLGGATSEADVSRAKNYQKWIVDTLAHVDFTQAGLSTPANILDIGCGNGLLAAEFQNLWPKARLHGVEPAHQAAQHAASLGIDVFEGVLEEMDAQDISAHMDLIYSVNVMEHSLDPALFLQLQKEKLSDDGAIVVICPNGQIPNIEMLFYDHITSFTHRALFEVSARAGLTLCYLADAPASIGCFQIAVFKKKSCRDAVSINPEQVQVHDVIKDKEEYLEQWKQLDQKLCAPQGSKKIALFGAGEMASILRAVTPGFWSLVDCLVVDNPATDNFHDKNVVDLSQITPQSHRLFIAVRPDFGEMLERRLSAMGFETESIHHYISN